MRLISILIACLVYAALPRSTFAQSQEHAIVKILPLGDSITQARNNRASYRHPLWKKLIDADIEFEFVGSMNTQLGTFFPGTPPQPDHKGHIFDPDHEGHYAWQASDIAYGHNPNNNTGSGRLSEWLLNYDFDIALVHLGTNDAHLGQSNAQITGEIKDVIEALRNDNPHAIVLLALLIPTAKSGAKQSPIERLNVSIPSLVSEMNTLESPVILVDQFTGFNAEFDTYDGVHPNARGEDKMAQRWFDAIVAVLSR